jgi:uncharacterized protein
MTPDVNILLAAARSDHSHHKVASTWLHQAVKAASRGTPLLLQGMVIASFLRLATHPKIFNEPTPIAAALLFIDSLLGMPGIVQPELKAEWMDLHKLCKENCLSANDIPDAWLAAAVICQNDHLVSFDAGFKRLLPRSRFTHLKS